MYAFDSDSWSLAGLITGVALMDEEKVRLTLRLKDSHVGQGSDGTIDTLENWENDDDLGVSVVNGLIYTVETDDLAVDGEVITDWTEEDFILKFGEPDRREQLTDEVGILYFGQGALLVFTCDRVFQEFVMSEPD